jgi:hypothetical protein
MIQVYKEAFKARATNLRAPRDSEVGVVISKKLLMTSLCKNQ